MSVDWYATMMAQRETVILRKMAEFQQLVRAGQEKQSRESRWMQENLAPIFEQNARDEQWHRFFEETSLFITLFDATGGPKQNVREAYFARVCPSADQIYPIPDKAQTLFRAFDIEPRPEALREALNHLPLYSWFLLFRFRLARSYLSKDDVPFYAIDNPVRKDKVFKLPMVSPASWKGSLRSAIRRERRLKNLDEERGDQQMVRLFGNIKGEEEQDKIRAGRLHFFPTFFSAIGQMVINPHDRKGGAGEQPIYFECVPQGADGVFALLYVPLGSAERPDDQEGISPRQIALEDMLTMVKLVDKLFTVYGFGAKTSSGLGVALPTYSSERDLATGREQRSGMISFGDKERVYGYRVGNFTTLHKAALAIKGKVGGTT